MKLWNIRYLHELVKQTLTPAKNKNLLSVSRLNTWYAMSMSNPQKQFDETLTKDKWDYYQLSTSKRRESQGTTSEHIINPGQYLANVIVYLFLIGHKPPIVSWTYLINLNIKLKTFLSSPNAEIPSQLWTFVSGYCKQSLISTLCAGCNMMLLCEVYWMYREGLCRHKLSTFRLNAYKCIFLVTVEWCTNKIDTNILLYRTIKL